MSLRLLCVGFALALLASVPAQAQTFGYGAGLKDRVAVPAPIPAPVPVPEGFSYYLRADAGWGFSGDPKITETGRNYGGGPDPFTALAPLSISRSNSADDVFNGTIGAGVYLTPNLRGDLTLDFRGKMGVDNRGTYSYDSSNGGVLSGNTVDGNVLDKMNVSGTVGLINLYWDILPRGHVSPYVGAGIGFVYNDIDRTYLNTEVEVDGGGIPTGATQTVTGSSKDNHFGLAAALMAGVTFAFDHRVLVDVNYRALYMDGGTVTTTLSNGDISKATLEEQWEHQIRVGLRLNIW